jgi:heme oxygenase
MFPPEHTPPVNVRDTLRLATRAAHMRLEAKMDVDRRLTSLEAYRSLLEDFLCFTRPLEEILGTLELDNFGIDFSSRRKSRLLEADLRDLGHSEVSVQRLPGACLLQEVILSKPLVCFTFWKVRA